VPALRGTDAGLCTCHPVPRDLLVRGQKENDDVGTQLCIALSLRMGQGQVTATLRLHAGRLQL